MCEKMAFIDSRFSRVLVDLTFSITAQKRLKLGEKWKLRYHQHWTGFHKIFHLVTVKYAVFELSHPENGQSLHVYICQTTLRTIFIVGSLER